MDEKRRVFRPCADNLEARVAMSVGADTPDTQAEITILAAVKQQTVVTGSLSGRYLATGQDNRPADAPLQVRVNAAGRVQGLRRVALTGSLDFGGFRATDQPDIIGTVTLTNVQGSVTVRLTGSGGNGQIPNRRFELDASIVSGTGAYANLRGIGTASALFGRNTVRSITKPSPSGGTLTLNLNLRPPIR